MKNEDREIKEERKYLRVKDLMIRYGFSRGHIRNLVVAKKLPPPMKDKGMDLWPRVVLDEHDKRREFDYIRTLREQGFIVPEDV